MSGIEGRLPLPIADITEFVLPKVAQGLAGQAPGGVLLPGVRSARATVRRERAAKAIFPGPRPRVARPRSVPCGA